MVHRGWRSAPSQTGFTEEVFRLDTSDPDATISSTLSQGNHSSQSRKKVPHVQEFAFVNATTPFQKRDPEVRKLVRGHAVKDSSRKRKLRRENETPTSKAFIVSSESITEVEEDKLSLKSKQISSETEEVTLATLPNEYFSSFPRKELDPHPVLSLIIHHVTEMGYAMYPDLVSFKMSPISPTAWFDSALRDEALFHALLFTTTSYAGLIGGSTETKESIVHFGKSVGLVKERLEGMCDVRSGRKVTVLVEGTARAISCLAFTEVSYFDYLSWRNGIDGGTRL
jgi:hypothetical protein